MLTSTTEFNFWDEENTKNFKNHVDFESSRVEFQTQTDEYSGYSPPLWASPSQEKSNLLPRNQTYILHSPTSRLQGIADGRRKLMKMIQNIPESSYELSLKDIVDDHQTNMENIQQDSEKKIDRKKKKSFGRSRMSRSESMDSGVFLLKMFFPSFLSLKKKETVGNRSKFSRPTSLDGSDKPVDKEWWSVRFLVSRKNKNSCSTNSSSGSGSTSRVSSSESTSRVSSSSSRNTDEGFTPGCWSSDDLCKSRRQRGCLF